MYLFTEGSLLKMADTIVLSGINQLPSDPLDSYFFCLTTVDLKRNLISIERKGWSEGI